MKVLEKILFFILRNTANLFLAIAIIGLSLAFGPLLYYEAKLKITQARGIKYRVASPEASASGEILKANLKTKSSGFKDVLSGSKEQVLIPKDTVFSILIPKLGINEKVFANTDPANEDIFQPILSKGVAHAKGTVFPGNKGNIYLFAHSTNNFWEFARFNPVFYLIKDLSFEDEIVIFFQDKRHNYSVFNSKIIEADDVSYLTKAQENEKETLILQACWPPGTTWKRLLVFAKPKSVY